MAEKNALHPNNQERRRGRPSKLTPEVEARIVRFIRRGLYAEIAAEAAGIAPRTLRTWRALSEANPNGAHALFFAALKKAEAEAEGSLVGVIRRAARDRWQAAAWLLERTRPDRYAHVRLTEAQLQQEREALLDALRANLAPEVYAQVLAALAGGPAPSQDRTPGAEDPPSRSPHGAPG